MKLELTIWPTSKIVTIAGGEAARVWEGATNSGVPVMAIISRVSLQTHDSREAAAFDEGLDQASPPLTVTGRKLAPR